MQQLNRLNAAGTATQGDHTGRGHPGLVRFDRVREVLVATGLSPQPETYEILYLHVSGADHALSREIERALELGQLDFATIRALRATYLGEIAASELMLLVRSTHDSAVSLISRLGEGRKRLESYDGAIEAEEKALTANCTVADLQQIISRLRQANREMMAANHRLEAEIRASTDETGQLLSRIEDAERGASTDPLTGLLNKRGMLSAFKHAEAVVKADHTSLSLALIDIDHFTEINRQWSVDIGDEVLRCIAEHLRSTATAGGGKAFAARYGSDEFVIVFPEMELQLAVATVEKARAALARQLLRRADDGATLGRVTFSAGVAQYRSDDSADTLIDRADAALFRAKRLGRDRVLPEKPD